MKLISEFHEIAWNLFSEWLLASQKGVITAEFNKQLDSNEMSTKPCKCFDLPLSMNNRDDYVLVELHFNCDIVFW
jgi:hypothetical protein